MHRFAVLCELLMFLTLGAALARQQMSPEQSSEKKSGKREEPVKAQEKEKTPGEPAEKRSETTSEPASAKPPVKDEH